MKAPRSKLGAVFYALKQGQESFELLYTVSYEAQAGSSSESVNGTPAYVYSVSI